MTQCIEGIEYVRCLLKPADDIAAIAAPVRIWTTETIPPEAIEAIEDEQILELGGSFGEREWADPAEYERMQIVTADGVTDIEIFNRGLLLLKGDEAARRYHRVAMKLGVFDEA
jgi:hypothetical protein